MLDTASNGNFLNQDVEDGWKLVENIALSTERYGDNYVALTGARPLTRSGYQTRRGGETPYKHHSNHKEDHLWSHILPGTCGLPNNSTQIQPARAPSKFPTRIPTNAIPNYTEPRLGYEGYAPTTPSRASQRVCSSCYTEKWATVSKQGSPPQIAVDIDDEEGEDLVEYDDIPAPNSIELEQNPEPELDRAEETETQKDKPELDRAEKRTDKASSSQPAKPVAKKKDTPSGPPPYKPPLPFPGRFKKQLLEAHKAKFDELMRHLS
ncbi:unnamed protein product [Microthlaspi erraticum]|uniref:Uncharacterized protein n=1 Tax=Microthlaspi erraticum TaxID=1685480 RepID=A0A6D2JP71_9BRAS|nr:unnamed protein product [Microthlaspi erraticum]